MGGPKTARRGHLRSTWGSKPPGGLPTHLHHYSTTQNRPFFSSQIIAILAAILFPVFAKAREKARQASCQSNVKQLMLAVIQYVNDYDERLPLGNAYFRSDPAPWFVVIMPYIKNDQVLVCPSYSGTFSSGEHNDPDGPLYDAVDGQPLSYGANADFYDGYRMLARYHQPAEWVYFTENSDYSQYWYEPDSPATCLVRETYSHRPWGSTAQFPHNDQMNLGFLDGHVKSYSKGAFIGAWQADAIQYDCSHCDASSRD